MSRTDPHRPSAFVPANYSEVLSYILPGSDGFHYAADCTRPVGFGPYFQPGHPHCGTACCATRLLASGVTKSLGGRCEICGTHFRNGAVWRYEPTGEHIHLGCDCAAKYSLLADRSALELEHGRYADAVAAAVAENLRSESRMAFLAARPGLEQDLKTDHRIVKDIAERFWRFATLSAAQVDLVRKLAAEARDPGAEEKNVPAPTGKVSFCGTIVSFKTQESDYGLTRKMVVKVQELEGCWLCYVTVPSDAVELEKNDVIQLSASLEKGRDVHFAFGKRPTLLRPWVRESSKLAKVRAAERDARVAKFQRKLHGY